MSRLIWIGLFVGSALGGSLPSLFGADTFSLWAVLGSVIGGVAGVFGGQRIAVHFGLD
jgi:hypothetical protein